MLESTEAFVERIARIRAAEAAELDAVRGKYAHLTDQLEEAHRLKIDKVEAIFDYALMLRQNSTAHAVCDIVKSMKF